MSAVRSSWIRFRNLFRRDQLNCDLDNELAAHLEMNAADNLRSGMSPAEAHRQALLRLGGLQQTRESYRAVWGFPLLQGMLQDLRFALRSLVRSRGLSLVAIFTL